MDLLLRAKAAYPRINFRYVVAPTNKLEGGLIPFTFDVSQIESNINKGIKDAQQVVALGAGKSLETLVNFNTKKTTGKFSGDYGDFLKMK